METGLTVKINHSNIDSVKKTYESAKEALAETPIYKALAAKNKEIAMCFLEPKIRQYDSETLKDLLDDMIVTMYQKTGFTMDQDNINDTLHLLVRELQMYFGLLTIREIELCFEKGCRHEYGSFTGLNNATYFSWLNLWIAEEDRIKLRKLAENRMKPEDTAKPVLTPEQKEQIVIDGIVRRYKDFCEGKDELNTFTIMPYDFLKRIGAINNTKDQKDRIMEMATKDMHEKAIAERGTKPISKAIGDLTRDDLAAACKRRALKEYFENSKAMDVDMLETITECIKQLKQKEEKK